MRRQERTPRELALAQYQARMRRWKAPGVARVTHPDHRPVIVPHASNLASVMCAAELWGVSWHTVIRADVRAVPPGTMPERIPRE